MIAAMKLVLMEFVSLDGVSQGPGAPDEDTTDGFTRGGWFVPHLDETFIGLVQGWAAEADAYLFGRRTYEAFARDWPAMDDPDDLVATSLNHRPKYVASNTLTSADWDPTTILSGDVASAVRSLKEQEGRELQIHGSARLGRSMLAAGLVDELRLAIAPVVVGSGRRLLEPGESVGLSLQESVVTPGGLTVNTYAVTGEADVDTYDPEVHTFADAG
jgi:dihydrofolate reductase